MKNSIYRKIQNDYRNSKKSLAVLIDPDKVDASSLHLLTNICIESCVDYILLGGSLITNYKIGKLIEQVKSESNIPVLLFPGNYLHVDLNADGILFLSLISGRNPDLLIGQQVIAAPLLKKSNMEVISTGYMLIDSGNTTTVSYMSQTLPIPREKKDIAVATALAGEYLGMKMIYLDGGSGAKYPVDPKMITSVKENISIPLIVGGGLRTIEKAVTALESGADIIVIGNGSEKNPDLIIEVSSEIHAMNKV